MQHNYKGHWKGWALKIETFLGPEMARAKRVPFGPIKVAIKTTGTLIVIKDVQAKRQHPAINKNDI